MFPGDVENREHFFLSRLIMKHPPIHYFRGYGRIEAYRNRKLPLEFQSIRKIKEVLSDDDEQKGKAKRGLKNHKHQQQISANFLFSGGLETCDNEKFVVQNKNEKTNLNENTIHFQVDFRKNCEANEKKSISDDARDK